MSEEKDSLSKFYLHFDLFGLCWNFHILPKKDEDMPIRFWGYREEWYDGPIHVFGLGPLLYICTHEANYIHRT